MFNLTANIKEEHGSGEMRNHNGERPAESCEQKITDCASVFTGLSHEMRTQMNAIVAFSFLLNKSEYNEEEKDEFSRQIYSSCEQIISLFDNFLDSAIIDTGNSKADPVNCNPDKAINSLFTEFRGILKNEKYKELILVTENQSFSSPEYLIDINRVTRVIRNLFQNALANTKSGYIKIGYYFRDNKLTFCIHDSGQGYFKNKEFLQCQDLSIPLSRFCDTYSAVNLVLARKLIQIMEGSVWIECNGLTGSSIYFTVPAPARLHAENNINNYSNTMSTI